MKLNSAIFEISMFFVKIKNFYYAIKWSIINLFKYFKIVTKMRPWDYAYILEMLEFQLKDLCHNIEVYGHEVDEDRLPRIEKMKRAIELLKNHGENEFYTRCGLIPESTIWKSEPNADGSSTITFEPNPEYPDYDEKKVWEDAEKLENDEWEELFNILKNDMKGWWD